MKWKIDSFFIAAALLMVFAGTFAAETNETELVTSSAAEEISGGENRAIQIQAAITGDGSVLLRGTVSSDEQRQMAEAFAAGISGVTRVRNELEIPSGE